MMYLFLAVAVLSARGFVHPQPLRGVTSVSAKTEEEPAWRRALTRVVSGTTEEEPAWRRVGVVVGSFLAGALTMAVAVNDLVPTGLLYASLVESPTARSAGSKFESIVDLLERDYINEIDPETLLDRALQPMLEDLDPYTQYTKAEQTGDLFESVVAGRYGGVGLVLGKSDDKILVVEAYEGYAYESGLRPGDRLLRVGDLEIDEKTETKAVSTTIRGKPGTTVKIEFQHPWSDASETTVLTRYNVRRRELALATLLDEDTKDPVAYLRLTAFTRETAKDVDSALRLLEKAAPTKTLGSIILDLRGNPGGLLESAVELASLFAPQNSVVVAAQGRGLSPISFIDEKFFSPFEDTIFSTRTSVRNSKPVYECVAEASDEQAKFRGTPLVIIVDGDSASASEVVAAAVQDLDLGVIIGEKTFGKGLIQDIAGLPSGATLRFTVGKYLTPSGRSLQEIDYATKGKIPQEQEFRTSRGRLVKENDGVSPDLVVGPANVLSPVEAALVLNNVYNKYFDQQLAVQKPELARDLYARSVADDTAISQATTRTDAVRTPLPPKKILTATDFLDLERFVLAEAQAGRFVLPSSNSKDSSLDNNVKDLKGVFKAKRDRILQVANAFLRERYFRPSANLRLQLNEDPQVTAALSIVRSPPKYSSLLSVEATTDPLR